MINLYQILNIDYNASEKSIQAGIALYRLRSDANEKVVAAAREWLLTPHVREQYDRKLFAHLGIAEAIAASDSSNNKAATPTYQIDKKLIPTTNIDEFEHLYQFLGIRTNASYAEIADAIEEAVLEGLNGKTIQLAREQLLDPANRLEYDMAHGIESAAAIMDANEPVSLLTHSALRLPNWLSFLRRQHKVNTINQTPTTHTTLASTPPTTTENPSDASPAQQPHKINQTESSTLSAVSKPAPTPAPKPQFTRDNWYHFLGIRGDASFHEIKVAIRQARLKGRDKELIRQAQSMLLKPGNRRIYDKQHNIAAFVAAQNGDIHATVPPTDYRPAPQIMGFSLQKCLLTVLALLGLSSAWMPWTNMIKGVHLMLTWPFFLVCLTTLACCACGHKEDPLYQSCSRLLNFALLPAAVLIYLIGYRQYHFGAYYAIAAGIGFFVVPWLFSQQSKNVSYQAQGQQLFALLALILNLIAAMIAGWYLDIVAI